MITTESYGCDKHGEDAYQGCAMCDLETLRERLHEAELVAASWKREAELNEQAANESSGYAKRLADYETLKRAINESGDCLPTCDSYAHDDHCPNVNMHVVLQDQQREVESLRSRLAKLQGGEACCVTHGEGACQLTCAKCNDELRSQLAEAEYQWKYWMGVADDNGIKSIKARLAEVEAGRDFLFASRDTERSAAALAIEELGARLVKAEALLREIYSYAEDQGMETLMDMIDAHLAREEKP
jgi:hypothetical protein